MIGEFMVGGQRVRVDFDQGTCIAIPLEFNGRQPSHFGAPPATAVPMRAGSFIGDVRQGGSCNVLDITLNPHCNGTHTESVGHIVSEPVPIGLAVPPGPVPATLVTLTAQEACQVSDTYLPSLQASDLVLTASVLKNALSGSRPEWLTALIIRTLPNGDDKKIRQWDRSAQPTFLTIEAIDYLGSLGLRHLLTDQPSVDRMHDEGRLTIHHGFWNVPEGTHALTAECRRDRTITEMIFAPAALPDGQFLLTIEVPAFSTDAAPSRPWLFPVEFV